MLQLLYLIAAFTWSGQQDWSWNSYADLGFKILSPYKLEETITQVPTELEVISYHQFQGGSIQDSLLSMSFVIDHYRLPGEQEFMDEADLQAFFENTLDPILKAVDGTLLYSDILSNGGRDMCSWKATYRNGECLIRGESMIIEGKYYGLQAFGWTSRKPEDLMNKFFESFRLITAEQPVTSKSTYTKMK